MASKQVSRFNFNFAELYKRCPKDQMDNLKTLHAKNREYRRKFEKLPEKTPIINWDHYKRNVRVDFIPMVEKFEQKYANFQIPYPDGDKYNADIKKLKTEVKVHIQNFVEQSNERIAAYEKDAERIRSMIPYEEMTWEEFYELCPDEAPRIVGDNPSFWPHTPEEQITSPQNGEQEPEKVDKKSLKKKKDK